VIAPRVSERFEYYSRSDDKRKQLPAARAAALKIGHLVAGDHVTCNRSEQLVKANASIKKIQKKIFLTDF
jgi:hypothetical protein